MSSKLEGIQSEYTQHICLKRNKKCKGRNLLTQKETNTSLKDSRESDKY